MDSEVVELDGYESDSDFEDDDNCNEPEDSVDPKMISSGHKTDSSDTHDGERSAPPTSDRPNEDVSDSLNSQQVSEFLAPLCIAQQLIQCSADPPACYEARGVERPTAIARR